jgi:hypothetical protein
MRRKLYLAGFTFAAILTGFFVLRLVFTAFVWMDPDRATHAIEGWMTPRYIGRTYGIAPEAMQVILRLEPGEAPRIPLKKLALQRGIPVEALIGELEALRLSQSPP